MPGPDPIDLLAVGELLTEEERLIQATVRRFADDRIRPHIADWFEQESSPPASWRPNWAARTARHAP